MKSKRLILLVIIGAIAMLIGCRNKVYSEKEISGIIEKTLREKYSREFTVQSLNKKDEGINFSQTFYSADCIDASGIGPFTARIENDGTDLKDNYEGYFYQQDINEDIQRILSEAESLSCQDYEVTFKQTERKSGSYEEYVKSGNINLIADLSLDTENEKMASEEVYGFLNSLQEAGYGANVEIIWRGKPVIFIRNGNSTRITRQDVERKFNL